MTDVSNTDHRDDATAHAVAHEHSPPAECFSARPHPEFVVLDIGERVGALIVHADPELHGIEVEISPAAEDRHRSHKEVLERSINGRAAFTAVFDGLAEGRYTLWVGGQARTRGVKVMGGTVGQLDWRTES